MNKKLYRIFVRLMVFVSLLFISRVNAQVLTNGEAQSNIEGQNPFMDASTNFDNSVSNNNIGKGLVFPRTDLTVWQFKTDRLDGFTFPSAFDGMIVYNTGTGHTMIGQGVQVNVEPGFYFFYNPNASTGISNGRWARIKSSILTIEGLSILAQIGNEADNPNVVPSVVTATQLAIVVTDVNPDNESAYQAYIDANPDLFSNPATVEEVQNMVTTVNTNIKSILAQIGNEGDNPDTIPSVVTVTQLTQLPVTGVVATNQGAYQAYIDANPDLFSAPATITEVQAMINAVNTAVSLILTQIGNEGDNPDIVPSVVTIEQLDTLGLIGVNPDYQLIYQNYIDANPNLFSAPATIAEVQAMLDAVNTVVSSILIQIGNEGDNPNVIPSVVTTNQLASVATNVNPDNEGAYQTYIDANPDLFSAPATIAEVQAMIDTVNTVVSDVLTQIGNEGDNPDNIPSVVTVAQLESLGLDNVVATNQGAYQTYIDANPDLFSAPATIAEVQAMINAVNTAVSSILTQIGNEGDNPNVIPSVVTIAQLSTLGLDNIEPLNETAYQAYIDANPDLFSAPATIAEVQAMIDAVNAAVINAILIQIGNEADKPDVINSIVTVSQLGLLPVTGVEPANELAYQYYIDTNPDSFSAPATVVEVQAMIDAVNSTVSGVLLQIGNEGDNPDIVPSVVTTTQIASLGIPNVNPDNESAYQYYIDKNPDFFSVPATIAEVIAMVTAVNNIVTSVLTQIGNEGDNPNIIKSVVTIAQLESLGVDGVIPANEYPYQAYIDANPDLFSTPATVIEVVAMLAAVNGMVTDLLTQIGNEADSPSLDSSITAAELATLVAYVDPLNEVAYQDYIDANPDLFSAPATIAEVQAMVAIVNAFASSGGTSLISSYTCSTASTGKMIEMVAVSGVTQTITANVATVGTYNISTTTQNGITFSKSGTFTATGNQNIVLTASGTPIAPGTNTFSLKTNPTCSFDRDTFSVTTNGTAVVSAYSCAAGSTGTMTAGVAITPGDVTQIVTATVLSVGSYSISITANGITFAGSGTFTGTGAQNIVLTATGTPLAAGTNNFVLNSTPNCNFSRTTFDATTNGTGVIDSIVNCSQASAGTLIIAVPASGITQTIRVNVVTVGSYNFSAIANGITFIGSGNFPGTGLRDIVLTATGTPVNATTNTFSLNTTPSCNFDRITLNQTSTNGTAIVSSYSCTTSSDGIMTVGQSVSGVTQTITANVTTVGTYNITATANGVTFAGSGEFLGNGYQQIILTATGTPLVLGSNNFSLDTSPTCSFTRITTSKSSNGTAVLANFVCSTASVGTLRAGIVASGVTQTITVDVTTAGTYNISATANGVTFSGSGSLSVGTRTIVLTATGTPQTDTTDAFILNVTPGCSFDRTTLLQASTNGTAIVSSYSCTIASNGTLVQNQPVSGVTQTITANVTTVGTYDISTTANGVTFAASGTFPATGTQQITLIATGTPSALITSTFALNTTPSCSFTRPTISATSGGTAVLSGFTCNTASSGILKAGVAASGITQTITVDVTTAGTYDISATANGVTFRGTGSVAIGTVTIVLTATGIPTVVGTNTYTLNTTPGCSFNRTTLIGSGTNGTGLVSSYSCTTASDGILIVGVPVSGVTQTITANVTTVGTYDIQATANGVTFSGTGTFAGTGSQQIVLYATGTPIATGSNVSFTLNTSPGCSFNRPINSQTSNGSAVISFFICNTASTGIMRAGDAVSGVTQTITTEVTTAGTYDISAVANGVTFRSSGSLSVGTNTITLTATGTPTNNGTNTFTLNTMPNCSFDRTTLTNQTTNGTAAVSTFNCSAASTGTMNIGIPVSGVSQTITANVTTVGTYNISATANGVTFSRVGTFPGTGLQTIILNVTGTPTATATSASFVLNTSPGCSFNRPINSQTSNGTAVISSFTCNTASSGIMNAGVTTSGVTQTITAEVITAGTYNISAVANGVTFAGSGSVSVGTRTIVLTATGIPTNYGTNTFTLNTTPNCSFDRTTLTNSSTNGTAAVSSFSCNTASTGTMNIGIPVSGVSQTITVNVTVVGTYDISATANGVTFSKTGAFTGTGSQTIVLEASGTPTATGTSISFALNTSPGCSFNRAINSQTSNGTAVISFFICNTASAGIMRAGTVVSGVTQTITAEVTTAGTYNISTVANGITFAGSGSVSVGTRTIVLTATGTPTNHGTNTFTLNTTPNCSFDRTTLTNSSTNGTAAVSSFSCNTASTGTMNIGIPVSGVTQTITANVTVAGTYNISTATVNGVTFSGTGTFAGTGSQTIVLEASGTPTATGTGISFPLNTTPTCSFNRPINSQTSNGTAVISYFICNTASAGIMRAGTAVSGVTQTITAEVTTAGTYDISAVANGVTFRRSGSLSIGTNIIVLAATGNPNTISTNTFTLNTTPNCSFDRITLGNISSGGDSVISSFDCGTATAGSLLLGVPASGVTQTITANVTTAGTYFISTTPVNGITFSGSGNLTGTGSQTIVLTASGTPTAIGHTSYTLNTTPNCSFSKPVNSATPAVTTLNCESAVKPFLILNVSAVGQTLRIPYSGGNSQPYLAGTSIASTGVIGLTATLAQGTLSSSTGQIVFNITGTPTSSGNAVFDLQFYGQTCSVSLPVNSSFSFSVATSPGEVYNLNNIEQMTRSRVNFHKNSQSVAFGDTLPVSGRYYVTLASSSITPYAPSGYNYIDDYNMYAYPFGRIKGGSLNGTGDMFSSGIYYFGAGTNITQWSGEVAVSSQICNGCGIKTKNAHIQLNVYYLGP